MAQLHRVNLAAKGKRGVPDTSQTNFLVNVPLVFETYKADWESFPPPTSPNPPPAPAPWTSFAGTTNPCGSSVNVGWGDVLLASDTKFGNLGLAGFGNFFVGPVISSGFAQSTRNNTTCVIRPRTTKPSMTRS